nr:type IV toxin-antitoxin system AbiEi family antitoxin domain-containing protein [Halobellus captivus]
MSSTARASTVVRKRADWMRPIDERILETMRDEGNMTPQALDEFDVAAANYARDRLSEMARYGLVERLSRGLYRLRPEGEAFLDEDLDAAELDATE